MKRRGHIFDLAKGFSLIELLVVIAIIGVLIAVGTASYLTAQKQTRDTRRKTDLMEIRQALETYRSEEGAYPNSTASLVPNYITSLPTNPPNNLDYPYTRLTVTTYSLCATLEIATPPTYCVTQP